MTAPTTTVPARAALDAAIAANDRLGHENRGFLSETHGFLPRQPPLLALPASHRVWDETATRLSELFRNLTLRETLERMPVLPAGEHALDERFLLRASTILSICAHAYHYVEPDPPGELPAAVAQPWRQVSERLRQPGPHLSFNDMNLYNWRLRDPRGPIEVANLALAVPIVGNEDERRFQMTPVEMTARFAPIVGAVVRAQEAVTADDPAALRRELLLLADTLHALTFDAFAKVDPNPHSPNHVNPVVWGKTVAPLATPFQPDPPPGPSGTAIPAFQLLDAFFDRRRYSSTVGQETARARRWFPEHWRAFLDAVEAVPVPTYVTERGDRALRGLFSEALQAYAGDGGLLGRHRLKTFGYLDLSFKAGRAKTLGGFAGSFDDRPWDRMDDELGHALRERSAGLPPHGHVARVTRVETLRGGAAPWVGRVTLDVAGSGLRYRPGARCSVLPDNPAELVERTLRALHARGDEPIALDAAWRAAVAVRDGHEHARVLPLRLLLTFGRIRPVSRDVAKALLAMSANETLRRIVEARAEDQWELWDLLATLADAGFRPSRPWKALPGDREHLTRIVPPETPRMFSIASAMLDAGGDSADELRLTVGGLRYETPATNVSRAAVRHGAGSNFLARHGEVAPGRGISVAVVQPPRFALPRDPRRPVIMIAAGTGISPFLGMLQARLRQPDAGETWLFFGARRRDDVYGEDELRAAVASGRVQVRIAFSGQDLRGTSVRTDERSELVVGPGPRRRVDAELRADEHAGRLADLLRGREDSGLGASVYVCGRAGFAASVQQALEEILGRSAPGGPQQQRELGARLLDRLNGDGGYATEVYTTYSGPHFAADRTFDASEVVGHNDEHHGYWTILHGRVYDLTRFARLHPGGDKIIRSYAGLDATAAYRTAQHDVHPEVDALRGLYEIGAVRRLDFGAAWGVAVSPTGLRLVTLEDVYRTWIRLLFTAVEMENALANDYGIRGEPVTADERPDRVAVSPYKARLLFQTHRRFVGEHLAALTGPRAEDLWAVTSGPGSQLCDVRALRREMTAVRTGAVARAAAKVEAELDDGLRRASRLHAGGDGGEGLAWCVQRSLELEREDRRVLREVKHALCDGVRVFERLEAETFERGAGDLLAVMTGLPRLVEGYLGRVAALPRRGGG